MSKFHVASALKLIRRVVEKEVSGRERRKPSEGGIKEVRVKSEREAAKRRSERVACPWPALTYIQQGP